MCIYILELSSLCSSASLELTDTLLPGFNLAYIGGDMRETEESWKAKVYGRSRYSLLEERVYSI